jgi:hypothetical protein
MRPAEFVDVRNRRSGMRRLFDPADRVEQQLGVLVSDDTVPEIEGRGHLMATTRRFSLAVLAAVLISLASITPVRPASAATSEGACPSGYELVTVKYVLKNAGLSAPDPSMDVNGDGLTCLKLLDTGSGTRATWHDNVLPN